MRSRIVRHAYLIMAHRDARTLEKLLQVVDDSRNDIFLHVDPRADIDLATVKAVVTKSGLRVLPRMKVYWGDYSQIACELLLLKHAVAEGYDYYHLLSGADLPVASQDHIHAFFER